MTSVHAALARPPRLQRGDRVAVVSPAGPVTPEELAAGCAILASWGLDVVKGAHVTDIHPTFDYLAGEDEDRAADLQAAWLDPSVSAVMCARGGYGAQRMLDHLDWEAMRAAEPKVLSGYSDITVLHAAFATQLGVATLHGPMIAAGSFVEDGHSADMLRTTLFEPESSLVLTSPTAETLAPGTAHGVVVGGCLSLIAADVGSATARPDASGAIVVLEDVEEDLYRIDRLLTQLLRSGWFDGVAGIVLGSWADCEDGVRELALDRLGGLGVPMVWELGVGHCPTTLTVPLGVAATLDADAATLTLDVPALR